MWLALGVRLYWLYMCDCAESDQCADSSESTVCMSKSRFGKADANSFGVCCICMAVFVWQALAVEHEPPFQYLPFPTKHHRPAVGLGKHIRRIPDT